MPGKSPRTLPVLLPTGADRAALLTWLATRVAVAYIALLAARLFGHGDLREPFLDRWTQWDADLLIEIARFGYGGDPAEPPDPGLPAFFPAFPAALRAVHLVIGDWRVAGLAISLVAGAVAMVALARLGDHEGVRGAGVRAVAALLVSPAAVFLFAAYTEALFLALALPAWLLARRGRWELAAVCALGAASVRITGVFLAAALVVEFVTGARGGRTVGWRRCAWLLLPLAAPVGYAAYQWRRTGDWLAWQHAQELGWGRELVWPWEALRTTWQAAFATSDQFTMAFRVELLAAAVGVALTGWLLARRRWAETTYVGLQLVALLSSAFYLSIARATLLWWPLWLLIGVVGARRRWVFVAYLVVAAPVMAGYVVIFTSGEWAG